MNLAIALRASWLLAATAPVFALTGFHARPWQVAVAALVGSALGQLACALTRRRGRGATLVGSLVATAAIGAWCLTRTTTAAPAAPVAPGLVVVANGAAPTLTWDDVHALEAALVGVAPEVSATAAVVADDRSWSTRVIGTTPADVEVRGWRVADGDGLAAPGDERQVVLGATVAQQLFDAGASPVGQVVRIDRRPFTVVGVLAATGLSADGQDDGDRVLIPLGAYQRTFGASARGFGGHVVVAPSADAVTRLRALLRERHRLGPDQDDDFVIRER